MEQGAEAMRPGPGGIPEPLDDLPSPDPLETVRFSEVHMKPLGSGEARTLATQLRRARRTAA
jgi:hypothetical protein